MKKNLLLNSKLYCIFDIEGPVKKIRKLALDCAQAGADIIQLRDKSFRLKDLLFLAKQLKKDLLGSSKILIINDRPDVVKLADVDGCHLGQDDLPIEEARKLIPDKIIGISCHSWSDIYKAQLTSADYLAIGPVFKTSTKPKAKPVGPCYLKKAAQIAKLPIFAIGAINKNNLNRVIKSGLNRVAVISAVRDSLNPKKSVKELKRILENESA